MSNSTQNAIPTSNGGSTSLPETPSSSPNVQTSTTIPAATTTSIAAVTSTVPPSSSAPAQSTPPVSSVFSVVTQTQATTGADGRTSVVVIQTSISTIVTSASSDPSATSAVASSSSSAAGSLQADGSSGGTSSSTASTVAPAVVVPVVVLALLIGFGLWFWRRRKASKEAAELRRKEVEDYGFNPNEGALAGGALAGTTAANDNTAMSEADGSGYRGWGTTTTARKASTTLGSGSVGVGAGAIGIARSDSGGNGGNHSPNGTGLNGSYSDQNSGDPLVNGNSRPISQDFEGVAALGGAPAAGSRSNTGVKRGPSNASSAYSAGQRSDTSNEAGGSAGMGSPSWENQYLNEVDAPYGNASGGAPVIRDVSARRNTRIEQPSVMPQQARGGISQNF